MKLQKGFIRLRLVITVIVLMLLVGVTTYVAFQDNGIVDQIEQNIANNIENKTVIDKNQN